MHRAHTFLKELTTLSMRQGIETDIQSDIADEISSMAKGLKKIHREVAIARQQIETPTNGPDCMWLLHVAARLDYFADILKLQRALSTAEKNISSFKDHAKSLYVSWFLIFDRARYDELTVEEKQLRRELAAFERQMESWDAPEPAGIATPGTPSAENNENQSHWDALYVRLLGKRKPSVPQAKESDTDTTVDATNISEIKSPMRGFTPEERAAAKARIAEWHKQRAVEQSAKEMVAAERIGIRSAECIADEMGSS